MHKLKLGNHQGHLAPMQQSRLEKEKIESNKWTLMRAGDSDEQTFEVHGWPCNMLMDLGKQTCSYWFWQLTSVEKIIYYYMCFLVC